MPVSLPGPKFTVILPTQSGLAGFDASVASVLAQSYSDWELLTVVDGAGEQDFEDVRAWTRQDRRIRSIHLANRSGAAAARNVALRVRKRVRTITLDGERPVR